MGGSAGAEGAVASIDTSVKSHHDGSEDEYRGEGAGDRAAVAEGDQRHQQIDERADWVEHDEEQVSHEEERHQDDEAEQIVGTHLLSQGKDRRSFQYLVWTLLGREWRGNAAKVQTVYA